ncbi:phosphotransferase family protein [Sphingobium sp. SCG-1]|uniref:phosphotransferase family protein n=1 Tax=Sphingobium sp. SCG-1 TaxID=2072936 RepID=UPI0011AB442F|nr:phosphotransferase family protein [Sphingobium sp. SCG-1]
MSALLAELLRGEGGGSVIVEEVQPLPGHAGIGFSFIADDGASKQKLIVRTIAPDAPSSGPSDVIRQARIMQSLAGTGVPVPPILSFGGHDSALGRPYFIAGFVTGNAIPARAVDQTPAHAELARRGVEVMARLHSVPMAGLEQAWGPVHALSAEFDRLNRLLDRSTIDIQWAGRITMLRDRLTSTIPKQVHVGCVHGDMHFGNMIFGPDDVRAVLDWEIAFLGSTLLDLGALAFYADKDAVLPDHRYRAERWVLSPEGITEIYRQSAGHAIDDRAILWHRAMAGYRFAVIALFNEMLHRRGKKHDPLWADLVRSVPVMVERSLEMLDAAVPA